MRPVYETVADSRSQTHRQPESEISNTYATETLTERIIFDELEIKLNTHTHTKRSFAFME